MTSLPMDIPQPIPKGARIPFTIGGAVERSRASEDPRVQDSSNSGGSDSGESRVSGREAWRDERTS